MGRIYAQPGEEQGLAVLGDLAGNPATARHLADQFARYFVADDPDPALVDRLATVFLESDGDLREMAWALIDSEAAWRAPRDKPDHHRNSSMRRSGRSIPTLNSAFLARTFTVLGQPIWGAAIARRLFGGEFGTDRARCDHCARRDCPTIGGAFREARSAPSGRSRIGAG